MHDLLWCSCQRQPGPCDAVSDLHVHKMHETTWCMAQKRIHVEYLKVLQSKGDLFSEGAAYKNSALLGGEPVPNKPYGFCGR